MRCIFKFCRKRKRKTDLIFTLNIPNFTIKILSMQLEIQKFVDSILGLVDHDTQQPIDATFTNVTLTSSDVNVFTADTDVNNDGTADIAGVAEGSADLKVTADATYIDSNTGQETTQSKEATVSITVTKPLPGAENTDLVVSFTNPQ